MSVRRATGNSLPECVKGESPEKQVPAGAEGAIGRGCLSAVGGYGGGHMKAPQVEPTVAGVRGGRATYAAAAVTSTV